MLMIIMPLVIMIVVIVMMMTVRIITMFKNMLDDKNGSTIMSLPYKN